MGHRRVARRLIRFSFLQEVAMKSVITIASIPLALALAGCNRDSTPADGKGDGGAARESSAAGEHAHGSGPHGGVILEWGGGAYHLEFTVDHDAKRATVYVLGGDARTASPIKATELTLNLDEPATEVSLAAEPEAGEEAGSSSRFARVHDALGTVREFSGSVTGVIDGTPYVGEFAEPAADK
jgi:hypothetical protein